MPDVIEEARRERREVVCREVRFMVDVRRAREVSQGFEGAVGEEGVPEEEEDGSEGVGWLKEREE